MNDKEPTEAQVKEFWEWVFGEDKVEFHQALGGDLCVYQRGKWVEEDEEFTLHFLGYGIETIDSNNLFKYPVPKLSSFQVRALLSQWIEEIVLLDRFDDKKCALALFWVLYPLIKKEVIHNG